MSEGTTHHRRRFVVAAALAAGLVGTYQFAWPVFRDPLASESGASSVTIGTVFTVLVVAQTLAAFPSGWVRDRIGPRIPMLVATLFVVVDYAGVAFVPETPDCTSGSPSAAPASASRTTWRSTRRQSGFGRDEG